MSVIELTNTVDGSRQRSGSSSLCVAMRTVPFHFPVFRLMRPFDQPLSANRAASFSARAAAERGSRFYDGGRGRFESHSVPLRIFGV
jgi:hypothetical protein